MNIMFKEVLQSNIDFYNINLSIADSRQSGCDYPQAAI